MTTTWPEAVPTEPSPNAVGPWLAEVQRLRAMPSVDPVTFEIPAELAFALVDRILLQDQLERDWHGRTRFLLEHAGAPARCVCGVEGWDVQPDDNAPPFAYLFTEEAAVHDIGVGCDWKRLPSSADAPGLEI